MATHREKRSPLILCLNNSLRFKLRAIKIFIFIFLSPFSLSLSLFLFLSSLLVTLSPSKMQSFAQKFTYDVALWIFNLMLDIFFREVRPRGAHKIPKEGPVIFVVAPHANQVSVCEPA